MKIKIKIAEMAQTKGFKNAFALQNALQCSPTMAARLWKGDFKQIGIETLDSLCELFQCQTSELLEYPLTQTSKPEVTQTSKFEVLRQNSPVISANPADVVARLRARRITSSCLT